MRQQHEPDSRILICLGPCHGEFYYPLGPDERIGCPTDATHPVAVYQTPTIHKGEEPEPEGFWRCDICNTHLVDGAHSSPSVTV